MHLKIAQVRHIALSSVQSPIQTELLKPSKHRTSMIYEIVALGQSIGQDHQACISSSMSAVRHAIEVAQILRAVRGFVGQDSREKLTRLTGRNQHSLPSIR